MRWLGKALLVVLVGSAASLSARTALGQQYEMGGPPPPAPIDDHESAADAQPPYDAEPPAQIPDEATFEQNLAPYGHWIDSPDYGRIWTPAIESADWRPYCDGRWVPTSEGWSYSSEVPWGWAVYHFGRWGYQPDLGWFWLPGFVWSPGWVSFRYAPGYVSWSPLPPSRYRPRGVWPGWVSVPEEHFAHPIKTYALPRERTHQLAMAGRPAQPHEWAPLRGNYRRNGPAPRPVVRAPPPRERVERH